MKEYRLKPELVPEACWRSNLRSWLTPKEWDVVRRDAYKRAGYQCCICGAKDRLEAHERWSYDDKRALQTLEDVLALCHACHEVVHISRTQLIGRGADAMEHFMRVNGCSQCDYHAELARVNTEYLQRNKIEEWSVDISWLKTKFLGEKQ